MDSLTSKDVGLLSDLAQSALHTIRDALVDTFSKAWSYEANYPQMLDTCMTDIIAERVQHLLELYDTDKVQFRRSQKDLLLHPQSDIQAGYRGGDLFRVDTSTRKDMKGDGVHLMHQANHQHKQLYYCLYVVALFQNSMTANLLRAENYYISLEAFKKHHRDTYFEVTREWQQAGGAKKRVPARFRMADAFSAEEWEDLHRYHNLFVLCFFVSPAAKGQKSLFIHVASILAFGKRAPQGGKPGKLIAAVSDVVFPSVNQMMCPGKKEGPKKKTRPAVCTEHQHRAACVAAAFAPIARSMSNNSTVTVPARAADSDDDVDLAGMLFQDMSDDDFPFDASEIDANTPQLRDAINSDLPCLANLDNLKRTHCGSSTISDCEEPMVKRERCEAESWLPAGKDSSAGEVTFTASICASLVLSPNSNSSELEKAISQIREQVDAYKPGKVNVRYSLVATVY